MTSPSNILLDAYEEPQVSDWAGAPDGRRLFAHRQSRHFLGTPAYLLPEVAARGAHEATQAPDIYGLGAVLYQLLTGRPFESLTLAETIRAVQETEPARPRVLNPSVPAELETICVMCLAKEPGHRYGTAQALAEDLSRFLNDEPILARPIGTTARLWRWCRRKPALAGSLILIVLLLLILIIGSPVAVYRINQARKAESAERQRAQSETVRAEAQALRSLQLAYTSDINLAQQAIQEGDYFRADQLLDATNHLKSAIDLRGWEWRYLRRECEGKQLFILGRHTNGVGCVGLMPDGNTVFSGGRDGKVRFWDLSARQELGASLNLATGWLAPPARRTAAGWQQ